jgi:hypothetical protein
LLSLSEQGRHLEHRVAFRAIRRRHSARVADRWIGTVFQQQSGDLHRRCLIARRQSHQAVYRAAEQRVVVFAADRIDVGAAFDQKSATSTLSW